MTQKPTVGKRYGAIGLAMASYAAGAVALVTSMVLTRVMPAEDFGSYRYIITVLGFIAVVTNLGLPYSAARILTQKEAEAQSRIIAASLQILMVFIGVAVILLSAFSFVTRTVLDVAPLLLFAAALIWTTVLQRHFQYALRGIGSVRYMAFQTLGPPTLILLMSAVLALIMDSITLVAILAVVGIAFLLTHVITATNVGVWKQRSLRRERATLLREQKTVGLPIYKGSLVSVGATELVIVIGGAYIGGLAYGSFALAMSLAAPVATLPSAIAMAQFRKFGTQQQLDRKLLGKTTFYSLGAGIVAVLAGWALFPVFYPNDFANAQIMFPVLAFAFLAHGISDYLNQFLQAQGIGSRIKRASYAVGAATVLGGAALIPILGVWGLVGTKVLGSAAYLIAMLILTYRWSREAN